MRVVRIAVLSVCVTSLGCGGSTGEVDDALTQDGSGWGAGEVMGTGELEGPHGAPRISVDARGGGEDVAGRFSIEYPGLQGHPVGRLSGPVTCLYVNANQAYIYGQIEQMSAEDPQQRWKTRDYLIIGLFDLGDATAPGAQLDRANFSPGFPTKPVCGLNPTATPDISVVDGDFNVRSR